MFSRLMLGTVQLGLNYGVANTHGKPSYETARAILKMAYDHGVTALDTAAAYGDSEAVVGKALAELGLADRMTVVSKIPLMPDGVDPERFIEDSLKKSLANLRLPVIPVVLMHNEKDVEYLPVLESMIGRGYIEGAGLSLDTLQYRERFAGVPYVQVPCNALDHRFDRWIEARDGCTFIRSVYLQGMLLLPEEKIPPELLPYRRKLQSFGMPMAELCMRYLFSLQGNVSVLTGVETLEQLAENLRLAELGPLPDDLFREVREAVPLLPETLLRPSLWPATFKNK